MSVSTLADSSGTVTRRVDALVIGAGFSGLYSVHRLVSAGLSVQAIDAGSDVGGTWHWNRYPGVRTDSESRFYAYTISKEFSGHDWDFTEKFPEGAEVQAYLARVADRWDLRRHYSFSTTVVTATFDESTSRWTVETDTGATFDTKYLVSAAGILSAPVWPEYPGIDDFGGECFHAARWPEGGVDLAGKRIAVIGTGSTGVQLVPAIADTADEVFVFQRTANYVLPGVNLQLPDSRVADRTAGLEELRSTLRQNPLAMPYAASGRLAMDHTPEERQRIFEEGWRADGFRFSAETFDDILVDPAANHEASEFLRGKIRELVKDPATAGLLTPDYPFGVKRPAQGIAYLSAFNRDDVHLVDVRSAPIVEITPRGIKTTDAEYEVDVIVFAIGYDAATGPVLRMNVTGRGGVTLADKWENGLRTYLSMTVADFPNFFMILGPQTTTGNMPSVGEGQAEWIGQIIAHAEDKQAETVEASAHAEAAWTDHVNELVEATLVGTQGAQANSWYLGRNVAGRAESVVVYFGGYKMFFDKCEEVAAMDYEGFHIH